MHKTRRRGRISGGTPCRKNYRISRFKKSKVSRPSRTYYLKRNCLAKKIALWSLIGLVFCGLVYFVCFSEFFMIREIEIRREENRHSCATDDDLRSFVEPFLYARRWLVFPQRNCLFFDPKVAEKIVRRSLAVDHFKVKKWPGKIALEIREKTPEAMLVSGGRNYCLSADGLAVRELPKIGEENELPVVMGSAEGAIGIREPAMDRAVVSFVTEANRTARERFKEELEIAHFEPGDEAVFDIIAVTSEGWKIYFDMQKGIAEQLDNLALVLKEQVKESRSELEYVDLRLGNRVFYKLKIP